jgi:hypothetical protein
MAMRGLGDRAGRRVKLRDLHVLLAVISGAAWRRRRATSTSQPVVSKTIAERGEGAGCPAARPQPAGIVPTMYGRA